MRRHSVDRKKNQTRDQWIIRRPDGIKLAYADTNAEAWEIARRLDNAEELRVLLAWQCGQLAESQACALLEATPEQLAHWRDTCLRGFQG